MFWHIDTDIVALLVMCALYFYQSRLLPSDVSAERNKGFTWCLRFGIIMTVIDILASVAMEVPVSRFVYHFMMTAYMLSQNLVMVSWFLYAITILYEGDPAGKKRASAILWATYIVYAALVLTNPLTGFFFRLGPNMEYSRGPLLIPLLVVLNCSYAIALFFLIFVRFKHIDKDYPKFVLVLQPVILTISTIVQLNNSGWLLINSGYMLCIVLSFLFFRNIRVKNEMERLKLLTQAVEHFACGMSISELHSDGSFSVSYISKGLAEICETDVDTLLKHINVDLFVGVHPEDKTLVENGFDDIMTNRGKIDITYRYITDLGTLKWMNIKSEADFHPDGSATVYATFTDLTKLKMAEKIIDVALKNTGVSIWEYDFKKRCIIQYQNSTVMHGFEKVVPGVPESLVNSGFVYSESAQQFLEMYDKLFNGAPFAEGVFKVQTGDRKGYWYEHIRYTNSFDENGKPYRAVGMSTDETQRQDAIAMYERELEKERGFMSGESLLAHATFDLTTGATLDYRYRDGTEVPESDRTAFDHAASNARLIIDDNERKRFLEFNDRNALMKRFSDGENDFKLEYRRTMSDGSAKWVRNTMRVLRDPRTGDILLFEYWYDIEDEMMQELTLYSIANDNYDFVARIDANTRRFDSLLKSGLDYHMPPKSGLDADEVTRTLYNESVHSEDREMAIRNSLVETIREHLKQFGRFSFTYRMTRPDGNERYKKITQYYIDPQREVIVVMREDITDIIREETDKRRVLSEALEAANQASRAKSQFLSRVSHELRTPLNAIIGLMELSRDADAQQVRDYLDNSDAAAKQLLSIINDVLDMSSIESGKFKIAHAPFDFKRLISNLTDMYMPQCRQKGLTFETVLVTYIDEWLMGDQLRVNQILLNLINNSIKFTSSGTVRLRISQRDAQDDRVVIRFAVEDTGCGMSEEMQKRLFKPFEQESATTAQKYGGNGLGLSIVGSLVSMMNGTITVKSQQGVGTTFTVDIPFVKGEAITVPATITNTQSLRVLAVDDEEIERDYVSAVLSRMCVRHDCAPDAKSAIKRLEQATLEGDAFNICLIDWKMPDVSGLDAVREIRAKFGYEVIVIVVSAYDHYMADETVRAAGANMFIAKPVFQSSLFDLFATITNGRVSARPTTPGNFDLDGMRILLVEDNQMNRMVAQNLIKKKFHAVCECAQDGKVAVDMFLSSPKGYYDAVLMDIQMPNMDGFEATRLIRASSHPDAGSVHIIALTANAFSEDVKKSLTCGMDAHISKPIEPSVLGSALMRAFRRSRERTRREASVNQ